MTYAPYKGGTLLVPSGPSGMHLFVILTNKCANGSHLLVSVTSIKQGKKHDEACVFNGGEHEFIQHPSFVYYRLAEQRRSEAIINGVAKGFFVPKADMSEMSLLRICDGIASSEFIGRWAIEYYEANRDL